MFKKYEWTVVLSNEQMGFTKTFKPAALNYQDAAVAAFRLLQDKGYDDGDFIVTAIKRGTNV